MEPKRTNFTELCRLCLKSLNEFNASVSAPTCLLAANLSQIFKCLTNVDIYNESEEFPKNICSLCLGKLLEFDAFWKNAHSATRTLYELIDGRKQVTQYVADAHPVRIKVQPEITIPNPSRQIAKIEARDEKNTASLLLHEILDIKNNAYFEATSFGTDDDSNKCSSESANKTENSLICPVCKKCFENQILRDEHIRVYHNLKLNPVTKATSKQACPQCLKLFSNVYGLRRHIQVVHEGEKRYVCSFCQNRFGTRIAQKNHETQHTGERPFSCDLCQKGFVKKHNLKVHIQTAHGTSESV